MSAAFLLGGALKGATGVGAPFLAVPIMALLVDVPFAVAVFLLPNILTNALQAYRFRANSPDAGFVREFCLAGMLGAGIGTVALAQIDAEILTTGVAVMMLMYVGFRLLMPDWALAWQTARRIVGVFGGVGGFFQGSIGLSGPISVSFMSAVGLQRPQFVVTMSTYFLAMAVVQLPVQLHYGILTTERVIFGLYALVPLIAGMSIGEFLGRAISKRVFDRIIVVVLALLALKLLWG